ncbi:hypothetical protein AAF712_008300 [Marasmius tenuissimus]|uniref:Proteophosphoglycan ppg4 n=1 Tax=Marasmius tenuissimus TaxID=585030 RepID=A0ABR2ZTT4_9AGAR
MNTTSTKGTKHQHRRSHSRNASVVSLSQPKLHDNNSTTSSSLPTHNSTPSLSSISSAAPPSLPSSASLPSHMSTGSISSKRNSHHRRRSSVSTRTESADLMGVSLPDLPKSLNSGYGSGSDDDKDSIRRRALWALEGKNSQAAMGFQKVEIPDMNAINTMSTEKPYEFPTKPSFPPGSSFSSGSSHRDSFKIKPSSSAKDQLHTLVEEEEEEEDPPRSPATPITVPPLSPRSMFMHRQRTVSSPSVVSSPIKPTYAEKLTQPPAPIEAKRPRPLSLRPLSLTPESVSLPTPPTSSASPNVPPKGLRRLSLTASPSPSADFITTQGRGPRPVLHINPEATSPSYAHVVASSTSSVSSFTSTSFSDDKEKPSRRSSIGYKTSNAHGLPTPDQTPTWSERRFSTSSISSVTTSDDNESQFFRDSSATSNTSSQPSISFPERSSTSSSSSSWANRPLSASEQHFLFKSHNALLTRIQDLEKALSGRVRKERETGSRRDSLSPSPHTQSRPLSTGSDISSISDRDEGIDGPSDELLSMIRDLKAERDELKRDVDGWRRRVGEGEKAISVLSKRVESERREAWVARGRVGVAIQEKEILERQVDVERREKEEVTTRMEDLQEENGRLLNKVKTSEKRLSDAEQECKFLRQQLEEVQEEKDDEIDRLRRELALVKSRSPVFGAGVEDDEDVPRVTSLDFDDSFDDSAAYDAESEEADESEDEEDGLAGYEDEDPLDLDESVSAFSDDDTEDFSSRRKTTEFPVTPRATMATEHPLPTPPSTGLQTGWKFPSKVTESPATPTQPAAAGRGHRAARSLSMPWTFPKANTSSSALSSAPVTTPATDDEDVDHFFGCLEDSSSATSSPSTSLASLDEPYDYERKNAFTSGLRSSGLGLNLGLGLEDESFEDDEEPFPFELKGSGVEVPRASSAPSSPKVSAASPLDVVVEEDEESEEDSDEEDAEVDDGCEEAEVEMEVGQEMEMGGIKITFTPPKDEDDSFFESAEYSGYSEDEEETPPPVSRTASIPIVVFDESEETDEEEEDEDEDQTFRIHAPLTNSLPTDCFAATSASSSPSPERATPVKSKASTIPILRSASFRFPSTPVTPPNLVRSASASSVFSPLSSLSSSTSTPPTSASLLSRSPSPSRLPRLSSSPSSSVGGRISPSGFRAPSPLSNAFATPPNKRGGIMSPSLIPQPSPSRKQLGSSATFIRQPKKQGAPTSSSYKCKPTQEGFHDHGLFTAKSALNGSEEEEPVTPRASSFSFPPPTSSVTSPLRSLSSFMPSIPITSLWSTESSQKDRQTNPQKQSRKYVSKEAQLAKLRVQMKAQIVGGSGDPCGRCRLEDAVAL